MGGRALVSVALENVRSTRSFVRRTVRRSVRRTKDAGGPVFRSRHCLSRIRIPPSARPPRREAATRAHHMSERIESQKKRFRSQRYVTPRTWTAVISSLKITKGDEVQKYEQASPVESDIRARYGDEA